MHLPRIHHSYPGFAIVLLDYVYLQNDLLFSVGFALIFSDVFHHLIFEPFIKKHKYDIGMKHHRTARKYVARFPAAISLISVGLFALVTRDVPGSWLSIVGVGMLSTYSHKKTVSKVRKRLVKKKTGKRTTRRKV